MRSRFFTSLGIGVIYFALTTAILAQVAVREELAPQTQVYIIRKGDTLWDLSGQFLNSPWYWPQLWALNPYITNPHLIYPGEPLAMAAAEPIQVAEAAPPAAEAEMEMIAPPAEEVSIPVEAAPPLETTVPELVEAAYPPVEEAVPLGEVEPIPAEPAPAEPEEPQAVMAELPVPEEEPVISEEKLEIPEEAIYYVKAGHRGFITPGELEVMGAIVGTPSDRIMLSEGDLVFTNLGDGSGVQVGDHFSIVEQGERVKHPETGNVLGFRVDILGDLEIIELNGDVSTARINKSSNVISRGNYLRPFEPAVKKIDLKHFEGQVDGWIVEAQNPVGMIAENEIVYLDQGNRAGLAVGNVLLAYRPGETVIDPGTKRQLSLPPRLLGKIMIIDVKDRTASGLVTSSMDVIKVGDRFRSGMF